MGLEELRAEIDTLDDQLMRTLARRFAVCRDVAVHKARTDTPMMQPGRVGEVKRRAADRADRWGLPAEFVSRLYLQMIAATCEMEERLIEDLHQAPASPPPVFVGGDDRSGTTLVSVILDSHRDLVVGPELDYLLPPDLGPHLRECCRLLLDDDPRVRGSGVQTSDPAYAMGVQFARQARRFGVDHAELDRLAAEAIRRTGGDLVDPAHRLTLIDAIGRSRCAATGKRRWGVKIQRQIADAAGLVDHWPGARFVHVVRDGRDVAASQLLGGRDWGYRTIAEAADGWSSLVEAVRDSVPAGQLYEVRYEDLVTEPERVLHELLGFLGVDWDPAVLGHAETRHSLFEHPFEHPSVDAVRLPIGSAAVGRHRRDLSAADRQQFEALAGRTLQRLGYLTHHTPGGVVRA